MNSVSELAELALVEHILERQRPSTFTIESHYTENF